MIYGSEVQTEWTDQPPTPSDVSEWLREQRKSWSVRPFPLGATINEVTKWAREQGLKRLDWDFIPRKQIWFRDPQIAMIWDLCGPKNKPAQMHLDEPKCISVNGVRITHDGSAIVTTNEADPTVDPVTE